ncbi:MAG: TIGR03905 family TSCPD domain-containing protein [Oscillospiraceae bacterium]
MVFKRKNIGTCSRSTTVEIENNIIKNIQFEGGCDGNLKGIASLCVGMAVDDVIARVKGIRCGMKKTSCPDQLALALEEAKTQM